ncbi:hypothetical protein crov532 [Cafeteria roenbergensis virus]|uniref:Uncharacterized protein n=1 Tax=Cafeteria roenbergensis virus (strain BV-PW1) TaxID=693272 RepID=E3T5V3_CROVB|nr:hypothetical protein crov532 [Cafeteria roenbergensis virus BV-PW1]ADO67566.1 hypothetical protein crov532 [Cafeteria roenbergensis virus BV-PW1]
MNYDQLNQNLISDMELCIDTKIFYNNSYIDSTSYITNNYTDELVCGQITLVELSDKYNKKIVQLDITNYGKIGYITSSCSSNGETNKFILVADFNIKLPIIFFTDNFNLSYKTDEKNKFLYIKTLTFYCTSRDNYRLISPNYLKLSEYSIIIDEINKLVNNYKFKKTVKKILKIHTDLTLQKYKDLNKYTEDLVKLLN